MSRNFLLGDDDFCPGALSRHEIYWRDHQPWLERRGYKLRPRYMPDWKPSWEGTGRHRWEFEDAVIGDRSYLLDATRISDGQLVFLKVVKKSVHPYEVDIGLFFSTDPVASDPHNHCVPIYETLQDPTDDDKVFLVMPLLREYFSPPFETVGEVVEFLRQVFEGLQFMHKHHVAHRDCMHLNIMMDASPMYPKPFHPMRNTRLRDFSDRGLFGNVLKHYTRTEKPVKYYYVDFGISRRYNPDSGPPLEHPILGGDKSVPEFQISAEPCNPFPTDIYYLGNMVRGTLLDGDGSRTPNLGLEFVRPLITEMVQDDPAKRPNMDEVVAEFDIIRRGLSMSKLRSRLVDPGENVIIRFFRDIAAWTKRIKYIIMRLPALPTPR